MACVNEVGMVLAISIDMPVVEGELKVRDSSH